MIEKLLIIVGILLVLTGAGFATGNIKWERDKYTCSDRNHWEATGEMTRWWSIGSVKFYYKPVKWTCDRTFKVGEYTVENGRIIPK